MEQHIFYYIYGLNSKTSLGVFLLNILLGYDLVALRGRLDISLLNDHSGGSSSSERQIEETYLTKCMSFMETKTIIDSVREHINITYSIIISLYTNNAFSYV